MDSQCQPTPTADDIRDQLRKLVGLHDTKVAMARLARTVLGKISLSNPLDIAEILFLFDRFPLVDERYDRLWVTSTSPSGDKHYEFRFWMQASNGEHIPTELFRAFVEFYMLGDNCKYWTVKVGSVYVEVDGLDAIADLLVLLCAHIPNLAPWVETQDIEHTISGEVDSVIREIEYT